ncbi:hypothetical protein IU501_34715 [Nocardia otitidiscaviarum]|uniref:hypothetical protein n=1 Tax=Nocardia otitidiscaviarum TaxID=1823 RepID=UPI00189378B8|nr:hypothetical protein [Nocardia otitidiscaviarum]MBF6138124.1 hypothetical protein [Nocardia otitidiscaviarum]
MADKAMPLIGLLVTQLRESFSPNQKTPPLGGGTEAVRFLGGDGIPVAAWNGHRSACGCQEPMLWVRVVRRYRTAVLPDEQYGDRNGGCKDPRAITIEAGVLRCAVTDAEPTWEDLEQEALTQLDDAYRLDIALGRAMCCAEENSIIHASLLAAGEPWGPEGAMIAWTQWAHAQLTDSSR